MAAKKYLIGWREWVGLPDLGIDKIKAKVDTGARTSAIHAFDIEDFERDGKRWVRFALHPVQRRRKPEIWCEAPVKDLRAIKNTGGQAEDRYVIETRVRVGSQVWKTDLSLANRDQMGFRMLLGRTAVRGHMIIDPGRSYLAARHISIRKHTKAAKGKSS